MATTIWRLTGSAALIFILLLSSTIATAATWQPESIVVFGDSLSDNGNEYAQNQLPASPPYWHGRYSNGPVWIEYLAHLYQFIPAPKDNPDYKRNGRLRDHAFGGAVLWDKDIGKQQTLTLSDQIKEYLHTPHDNPDNTLAIIMIGANDFEAPACYSAKINCIKTLLRIQRQQLDRLHDAGILHVVLFTVPDISITPKAHLYFTGRQRWFLSRMINIYNLGLRYKIVRSFTKTHDVKIKVINSSDLFKKIIPMFNIPLQEYCYDNYGNYGDTGKTVCLNPNHYFFWDWSHPTTIVHQQFAAKVYQILQKGPL